MKTKKPKPAAYYPAFLNLAGKKCIVIGGGEVALRKIKPLLDCHANVTAISPSFHPELLRLAERRSIRLVRREYRSGDLIQAFVVISATDDSETNRRVAEEAKQRGVLINVVDDPEQSDFIVPASLRRGGLTIAISTSGMSPALAKKIRMKLEGEFGKEYATLLAVIEEVRSTLAKQKIEVSPDTWQKALDLDSLIELMRKGQKVKVRSLLMERLKSGTDH